MIDSATLSCSECHASIFEDEPAYRSVGGVLCERCEAALCTNPQCADGAIFDPVSEQDAACPDYRNGVLA